MSQPAYQQVKDFILRQVHDGVWREGDVIPSENELARRFRVARMTANRAVRELTAEQVLTRVQGTGTFVAPPKYEATLVEIRSIADEVRARGHVYACDVLQLAELKAEAAQAKAFEVRAGTVLFHSRLLHRENGAPVQLEERWVSPALAPDYLAQDFRHTTPSEYLVRAAPLQRVEYRIEACAPAAGTRKRLAMAAGEPCLVLHRRTWSRGTVASTATLWHPGGRYQFTGNF
ncbi:MAG: histidine utilization repressor [Myxococcaceae bacterium]|nr:histidine utilization repressor [Myxococcaceae bacterium]MCI0669379.1 histidine utilization repressor [Myxococcaceae bacterium]